MLNKLSGWLYRVSTGWVSLAGLVIFILFTMLVLPGQAEQAQETSGQAGSPDMSFFYSASDLYQMAESFGVQGRQEYIQARFTFDLLWPVVYTLFLATALSYLFGKSLDAGNAWLRLNLVPVLGMLLDYLENLSTSLVMYRYPAQTPLVDFLAPLFTMLKWVMVGGSFLLLVLGMLIWLLKRLKGPLSS